MISQEELVRKRNFVVLIHLFEPVIVQLANERADIFRPEVFLQNLCEFPRLVDRHFLATLVPSYRSLSGCLLVSHAHNTV